MPAKFSPLIQSVTRRTRLKTKLNFLALGLFLAAIGAGLGQPVITTQPQNQTNAVGTTATFRVEATGTGPLAYQWQKYLSGWWDLANCIDASLVLTNVQTSHAGDYRVVITNETGAVTSDVARLTVFVPPAISTSGQPTNFASVSLGATVGNRVVATGTAPLAYQWHLFGAPVAGQTTSALALTNVQLCAAGDYTVVVTNLAGSITSRVVTLDIDPTFTKITTGAIVTDLASPRFGSAWGDYDNDGYPDFFIHEAGPAPREVIYRNNGDGTFTRTVPPGLQGFTGSRAAIGLAWGDFDNDGNLDLFLPNDPLSNLLFRNSAGGIFVRVSSAPVTTDGGGSWAADWGDYDRDGYLDLFVINTSGTPPNYSNWLYRNNGDGTFTKITTGPIVSERGWWWGGGWVDFDEDGWPDLCVARYDAGKPGVYMCRNLGNGSFIRITNNVLATQSQRATHVSWGDYDNDGRLDGFVDTSGDGPNILYHNEGAGTFKKMTAAEAGSLVNDTVLNG